MNRNTIRKFLSLSRAERSLLFRAAVDLALCRVRLKRWPFPDVLNRYTKQPVPVTTQALPANRIASLLRSAVRLVPGSTCLPQALVGTRLLACHGYKPEFRIGALREAGRLDAHAWVELDGIPLIGDSDRLGDYVPLPKP